MLNKHNLNIAKLAPSGTGAGYGKNVIQVRQDRTIVTDGHLLVQVTRPAMSVENYPVMAFGADLKPMLEHAPFCLNAETALKAAKDLTFKSSIPILHCAAVAVNGDPSRPKIVTTDLERNASYSAAESSSYPDVDRVMPKAEDITLKIGLDARKVKALMDQFISFADQKGDVCVTFAFQTATSALTMTREHGGNESDQTMTALLMPMKF